jgi:hypothetical protein
MKKVIDYVSCEVDENCPLEGYCAASSDNFLATFRDKTEGGTEGCPETLVRNYHYPLRNNPEEHSFHLLRGGSLK